LSTKLRTSTQQQPTALQVSGLMTKISYDFSQYYLNLDHTLPAVRHTTYRTVFRQLHAPAVDLVSDPLTQPPTSSRGAEPSSANAVSVMLDPLLGTVFHTTFTKSLTLVFLSVA